MNLLDKSITLISWVGIPLVIIGVGITIFSGIFMKEQALAFGMIMVIVGVCLLSFLFLLIPNASKGSKAN